MFTHISLSQDANEFRLRNHPTYHSEKNWAKKGVILEEILQDGLDEIEFDEFLVESESLYNYSIKRKDELVLNKSRILIAHILVARNENNHAEKLLLHSKEFFLKTKSSKYLGFIHRYLGIINSSRDAYKSALSSYYSSIKYFKDFNLPIESVHSEALSASVLIKFKRYNEAEKTIKRCIQFMIKKQKYITIYGYYKMLANIYSEKNEKSKEKWANQKSYDYAVKSKNLTTISLAQNNKAIVEFYKGNLEESIRLFHKALETRINTGKTKLICESYYNIASVYETNNIAKAQEFYNKSRDLAKKEDLLADEGDALLALSELSRTQMDTDKALQLLREYLEVKEKMEGLNSKEQIESTNIFNAYELESLKIGMNAENERMKLDIRKIQLLVTILAIGYVVFFIFLLRKRKKKINSISKGN